MQEQQNIYQSVTKFVNFINDHFEHKIDSAILFFEGDAAFKNQFNNICIKPVFIQLNSEERQYINHKKILELFDGQLVISITENNKRKLQKSKGQFYKLTVDFKQKEFNNNKFYSSIITTCTNKRNIESIRKQVVTESRDEEIIPFEAMM